MRFCWGEIDSLSTAPYTLSNRHTPDFFLGGDFGPQGQSCHFELPRSVRQKIVIAEDCNTTAVAGPAPGYATTSDGYNFSFGDVVEATPGTYRMCACVDSVCDAENFTMPVGFFRVTGPHPEQYECELGSFCKVELRGTGLKPSDRLVASKTCGTNLSTNLFGDFSPISGSFNESMGSLIFDFGLLSFGASEHIQLCWCPSSHACDIAADYRAMAGRLHVFCAPGTFPDLQFCSTCPADSYCPGGPSGLRFPCPEGSTSLQGAMQQSDCRCKDTHFWNEALGACSTCPPGFGFSSSQATCFGCNAGTYSNGGIASCVPCPAGRFSTADLTAGAA